MIIGSCSTAVRMGAPAQNVVVVCRGLILEHGIQRVYISMPQRLKRPCSYPGCPALTNERYCEAHRKQVAKRYDEQRGTRKERGYDEAWLRLRRVVLSREPLCRECGKQGKVVPATEVDHIVSMTRGGARLDTDNLQPMCKSCHSKKTIKQDGGFNNIRK